MNDPVNDGIVIRCDRLGKTYQEGNLCTPVFDQLELAVRAGELANEFSGPALGEAVRKARIAAIAAATGKR